MPKRTRSSLVLGAALSSLVLVASAQAAPQQVTSWGYNDGANGKYQASATNPVTGAGLTVSYYNDGSTERWVAIPLNSSGTASGTQTVLTSGAEVYGGGYYNPAVEYDPVSGGWVVCLGNYSTKVFQCWFLNGDGTAKAGSPFTVSTGANGGSDGWNYYYNISIAYSAKVGKWFAVFNDYYNMATNWFDSTGTVTRGQDLITDDSGDGGLDLAYSPKSDKFMLVARWRTGADTQNGGYVWYFNGDGSLNSGPTRVGDGTVDYKNPVIAYNAVRDEFLVANFLTNSPYDLATQRYSASDGSSPGETRSAISSSFGTFRNRVSIDAPDYGDDYKIVTPLRVDGTSDYGNYIGSLDGAGVLGATEALVGPNASLTNLRPRVVFNQATCSYLATYNSPVGSPITSWELFSSVVPATNPCRYALTVAKSGSGSGTVTGGGIDCGSTCSAEEAAGREVTLAATAASGSEFAGWSGACSGTGSCTVSMTEARSVTAAFSSTTPPTPSNSFTVRSTKGAGSTITTRVTVPGAGRISQRATRSNRSGASARALVCTASRTAGRSGTYTLTCKANSATRKAQRRAAVRVLVRTTFTPTGGTARTASRTVVLPSLKPRYTG